MPRVRTAALKIAALSLSGYLADGWNVFDLVVVCTSLIDLLAAVALSPGQSGVQPTLLRLLRLTRILRTMRAIKSSRGLRTLLVTLFTSLPALSNVLSVFVLILVTYAVVGMHLFRHVRWADPFADFCSFPAALLTMLRCATGEGWNALMHQALTPSADCAPEHLQAGDCGTWLAAPFFVSHTILTYLDSGGESMPFSSAILCAIGMFAGALGQSMIQVQYNWKGRRLSIWAQATTGDDLWLISPLSRGPGRRSPPRRAPRSSRAAPRRAPRRLHVGSSTRGGTSAAPGCSSSPSSCCR